MHRSSIVKRDADLRVGGKMVVDFLDVIFEGFEAETIDSQHWCRDTFIIGDRVGDEGGIDGEERECLLSSKTNVEKELDCLEDVELETVPAV